MTVSNAQYTAWLAADNKERVALVEVQAYSGGAVVTRYLSNRGFASAPTDIPANTAYEDILADVPRIRSSMAEVFRGRSLVSFGEVVVDNSSGARDSWVSDAWDGRPVYIYLGDPSWPKSDFRLVFFGTVEDIQAGGNGSLTLRIRDRQKLFDIPFQTNRVGGTGSSKDQLLPACYGSVLSVEPILIDSATRKYAVHNGSVSAVSAVYVAGVAQAPANFTVTAAAGTFVMNVAVTGRVTCDVQGDNAATYITKVADIAQRIITTRTTVATVAAASVTQLAADFPGVAGIYVSDDGATVLNVLDSLLAESGCYFYINRAGDAVVGLFKAPSGASVITLIDDDIRLSSLELIRRINPLKSVRVGYARFQSTSDAGASALTEAQRQRLRQEYLVAYAATGAVGFLLALDGEIDGTPLLSSADAATEATRRATLWGALRKVFRFESFLAAQQVNLGDVVALNFSRYGLTGGVLATVVGLDESVTDGRITMEVFV